MRMRAETSSGEEQARSLRCLYAVSTLLSPAGVPVDELFEAAVELIPCGFTYAHDAWARIRLRDQEWRTAGYAEHSHGLSTDLVVRGHVVGSVDVGYRSSHSPGDGAGAFFEDERRLLTLLARMLSEAAQRVAYEEALLRSEERLRSLFDHNPQAVYGIDVNGRVTSANPAAQALIGFSLDELRGMTFVELLVPDDVPEAERVFGRVVHHGEPSSYEIRVRTRTGDVRELSGVSVPIVVQGEVVGVFGVAEDATERKDLEAQLRQAQKMEAIGRMAGGIAHDFNNLLTAISGHADLVYEQLQPQASLREDMEEIRQATTRAAALTRQLLAFSRRERVQLQVLDLNGVVRDVERLLRRLIGEQIELRAELGAHDAGIKGDRGYIEQVLMNLAVNARDAMPDGGVLTIQTMEVQVPNGRRRTLKPGQYVRLTVRDTGTGMTPDVQARVFEPFFTTKDRDRGTGLGLSTVYGIVQQCGGDIRIDTAPGRGTAFHVYLPAAPGAAVAA